MVFRLKHPWGINKVLTFKANDLYESYGNTFRRINKVMTFTNKNRIHSDGNVHRERIDLNQSDLFAHKVAD